MRERAVVIGAGFGGLIAAGVLSSHFAEVTVLDRDALPEAPGGRGRVPQALHLHGMLARGARALESLFPEFGNEVTALGGLVGDAAGDTRAVFDGKYPRLQVNVGIPNYFASRDLIEFALRRIVSRKPNVTIIDNCAVTALTEGAQPGSVGGVVAQLAGQEKTFDADLVVDSSGRTAPGLDWLAALGYEAPRQKCVRVNIVYSTRRFKRDPASFGGALQVGSPATKTLLRGGMALAQEDNTWIVTMYGYGEDGPPSDDAGYLAYARSLSSPDIAEIASTAEPLGSGHRFKVPKITWRDFKSARLPSGYIPFADAICAYNPIHAQGMTVAAVEGQLLAECLKASEDKLEERFIDAADTWVGQVWGISTPMDLRRMNPDTSQNPMFKIRDVIGTGFGRASARDPKVLAQFMKVLNLLAPGPSLMRPNLIARTIWASRPQRAQKLG